MTAAARKQAVADHKRQLILEAARRVFERVGLDAASLRAIAAEAGYTPAALYFHFADKEALYAEVLALSIAALKDAVDKAVTAAPDAAGRFRAAALAFFDFYATRPRDLDLGFYLFQGGMRPHGLGRARDRALNAALEGTLAPLGEAAQALGATPEEARILMADGFAHAVGLLLLLHTGRIRMFGADARRLLERGIADELAKLETRRCS